MSFTHLCTLPLALLATSGFDSTTPHLYSAHPFRCRLYKHSTGRLVSVAGDKSPQPSVMRLVGLMMPKSRTKPDVGLAAGRSRPAIRLFCSWRGGSVDPFWSRLNGRLCLPIIPFLGLCRSSLMSPHTDLQSAFQWLVTPLSRSSLLSFSSKAYSAMVPATLIHLQRLLPTSPP